MAGFSRCRVRDIAASTPQCGRIHAILLVPRRRTAMSGRSDSRSVAGFRGRHGMRRRLLAHRVGERPISRSLGSLVSHRHVSSRMTETSHQLFGRCALPGGKRGGHTSKPVKGEALQAEDRDGRPPNISPKLAEDRTPPLGPTKPDRQALALRIVQGDRSHSGGYGAGSRPPDDQHRT